VDSDFLPNYGTSFDNKRLTAGCCSYLAGACVSHCSRRQTAIATSTAHAEYLAAFECGREAIRIRVLLKDMGLPQQGATTIFEDNETCIRMSEADSSTPRTQYIDLRCRCHWLATRGRGPRQIAGSCPLLYYGNGGGCTHKTSWFVRNCSISRAYVRNQTNISSATWRGARANWHVTSQPEGLPTSV
jgi:hypothetical protein